MFNKNKETWQSWSSWSSPVGLGFFYLTSALAAAIVLYTLLNLAVSVVTIAHPAAAYPSMQQGLQSDGSYGAVPATQ